MTRATRGVLVIAISAPLVALGYWGMRLYEEVRQAGVRAFLRSVSAATEDYHSRHGMYPASLDLIDRSRLDYDLGIPLASLEYRSGDCWFRLWYTPTGGETVRVQTRD